MGLFARLKQRFSKKKTLSLGLALGSGGAKGMAHLGALKAFEEEGIKFSFVTGTSIGSIVGALYAKGYSCADMVQIVESFNRKEFSRNLRPFADLQFAEEYIKQYVDEEVSELPMPFAAWATNGETNGGVLLNEGKVAKICTASAAIPPFFRGVEIDGKKLYDGAYTNSIPADVCKDLGAQFVVGIDLSAYTRPDEEKSRLSRMLGSAINAFVPVKYLDDCKSRGYAAADIMLRPTLLNYSAVDVSREGMNAMFDAGYEEAKSRMEELKAAIENATRKK